MDEYKRGMDEYVKRIDKYKRGIKVAWMSINEV